MNGRLVGSRRAVVVEVQRATVGNRFLVVQRVVGSMFLAVAPSVEVVWGLNLGLALELCMDSATEDVRLRFGRRGGGGTVAVAVSLLLGL
jgi:hypothetical protein